MIGAINQILKELKYRQGNALLILLAVAGTVGFIVLFFTTSHAATLETQRIQRDMGANMRILPGQTDLTQYWFKKYSMHTMDEDAITTLANQTEVSINHLVGILQRPYNIGQTQIILTGVTGSVTTPGRAKKSKMRTIIKPGTAEVGFLIAQQLNLATGDTLKLGDHSFTVAQVFLEKGTDSGEDIRIYLDLPDAQQVLGLPGKINEIHAIDCLCTQTSDTPADALRQQLQPFLPDTLMVMDRDREATRRNQRQMIDGYMAFLIPGLLIAGALSIGVLSMLNVRERQTEIGIMQSLGHTRLRIFALFVGKAVLLGLVGAGLGYLAGTTLAIWKGPELFKLTSGAIKPLVTLFYQSLLIAPIFTAIAGLIPAIFAATQDPAVILRDD